MKKSQKTERKRIVFDLFGKPALEIDEDKGVVTALKDCRVSIEGWVLMEEENK